MKNHLQDRQFKCVRFSSEPADKNPEATEAWNPEHLVNRATREIKLAVPEVGVMLDVALDPRVDLVNHSPQKPRSLTL